MGKSRLRLPVAWNTALAWPSLSMPSAVDELALQNVQRAASRQAFDRQDVRSVLLHGERKTSVDPSSVDQHRAGPALALVAALLAAGERELLTQEVEQRRPRSDFTLDRLAANS